VRQEAERRARQAAALRANLSLRKDAQRNEADPPAAEPAAPPDLAPKEPRR